MLVQQRDKLFKIIYFFVKNTFFLIKKILKLQYKKILNEFDSHVRGFICDKSIYLKNYHTNF